MSVDLTEVNKKLGEILIEEVNPLNRELVTVVQTTYPGYILNVSGALVISSTDENARFVALESGISATSVSCLANNGTVNSTNCTAGSGADATVIATALLPYGIKYVAESGLNDTL
jgi:hypothetical protein